MTASLPPSPPYANADHSASPPPPPSASTNSSHTPSEPQVYHRCLWIECSQSFTDPEALYNHLCNDHIGRKSTNNLCLTCKWKDCGTSCAKRDHITSHLRVHTPLKPHVCEICRKSFKRPQDLKKHEKIHTEEHHAQHKHSKAITVVDPAYVQRVKGDESKSSKPSSLKPSSSRSKSHSSSASESSHFGVLPTPSPELAHAGAHHPHHSSDDILLQNQLPSWEVLRPEASPPVSAGSKRSHGYDVDEFFSDMKKRRVNPSYDPRMAERLNSLSYVQQQINGGHSIPSFNPRSVSFDIRTPEELAAVNEFLVTLGRDVSLGHSRHSQPPPPTNPIPPDYFDPVSLSQLGLAGMPGLAPASFPQDTYASSSPQYLSNAYHSSRSSVRGSNYGNMYSGVSEPPMYPSSNDYSHHGIRRSSTSSKYGTAMSGNGSGNFSQSYHHPTPPLEVNSPHSSASSPVTTTPPQISLTMPDFDYVRAPRGAGPVPTLSPVDFMSNQMRPIVPLKSVPGQDSAAPRPVEPKLSQPHRGPPARLITASASSSKPGSLYPLLTSGDVQYKLPPLQSQYRSPSPLSRDTTPSASPPPSHTTVLPSIHSLNSGNRAQSEELAREIGRIELENRTKEIAVEDRKKHAELIRNLLVAINHDFKEKYGAPKVNSPLPRDVEMVVA